MSAVVVRRKDNGWKGLLQRVQDAAKGARVRVGVLDDTPHDEGAQVTTDSAGRAHANGRFISRERAAKLAQAKGGISMVELAAIHEFGAPAAGIPQRSFIRSTVTENEGEIRKLQKAVGIGVVKGTVTRKQGLDQIGAKVAAMIQRRMAAGIDPPNAASTVERKGSSKPLIDTGTLRASITWRVMAA